MDYKKKYEESIERAKLAIKECGNNKGRISMIESIFPELRESEGEKTKRILHSISSKMSFHLHDIFTEEEFQCFDAWSNAWLKTQGSKESEDEKIRKNLIEFLDGIWHLGKDANFDKWGKADCSDWMDYLEKQGESDETKAKMFLINKGYPIDTNGIFPTYEEMYNIIKEGLEKQGNQTHTEKTQPKFKVGDWIVQENVGVYKVIEVCESWYEVVDNKDEHYSIGFDKEYMCHLWTIADAKKGDVLINKSNDRECPFIFKETKPSNIKTDCLNPLTVLGYCGVGGAGFTKGSGWGDTANCIYYPATKEQRDLLFQKMKEAGYQWNANNKELKRIKAAKPKFHKGDWIACRNLNTAKIISFDDDRYEVEFIDGSKGFPHIYYVDRNFHLWTIKDAEDGDMLTTLNYIYIFNSIDEETETVAYYGLMKISNEHFIFGDYKIHDEILNSVPATKEQRDIMINAMKEAGYEWNQEAKELKKIDEAMRKDH